MVYLPPGLTPEWIAQFEAWERRKEAVMAKAAGALARSLGMDAAAARKALDKIHWDFGNLLIETEGIEKAGRAKRNLRELAKKAGELERLILTLGQGATTVMQRRTVRLDLIADADPDGLPDPDPHPSARMFHNPETDEWEEDSGRWVARLRALAELAQVKADRIEKQAGKGGRKSFAARLNGESPKDRLALACKEFIEAHGCRSQAVAHRMVRAILEAEHGAKIGDHSGRKAVRKLAQTKPKTGTV